MQTQHGLLILDSKITGDWKYIMSEVTDKHGRITYNLPPEHSVGYGLYPVRMVVRGDHSCLHMTLACLPPKTETVRHKALEITRLDIMASLDPALNPGSKPQRSGAKNCKSSTSDKLQTFRIIFGISCKFLNKNYLHEIIFFVLF